MSRRNNLLKHPILVNADSAAGANSEPTVVDALDFITYQISVDSSVNGEFKVFYCNNKQQFNAGDAQPLGFDPPILIDGSQETEYMIEIQNKGLKYLYLEFTDNGGSGNINAWISGNSRGA